MRCEKYSENLKNIIKVINYDCCFRTRRKKMTSHKILNSTYIRTLGIIYNTMKCVNPPIVILYVLITTVWILFCWSSLLSSSNSMVVTM